MSATTPSSTLSSGAGSATPRTDALRAKAEHTRNSVEPLWTLVGILLENHEQLERELAKTKARAAKWARSKGEILAMYENLKAERSATRAGPRKLVYNKVTKQINVVRPDGLVTDSFDPPQECL